MFNHSPEVPWIRAVAGMRHGPTPTVSANQALTEATDKQIEKESREAQRLLQELTAKVKSIEFLQKFREELVKGYGTPGGM